MKYLSFIYLQITAEMVYIIPMHVNVFNVTDIPELCNQLSLPTKLFVKYQNYDCDEIV